MSTMIEKLRDTVIRVHGDDGDLYTNGLVIQLVHAHSQDELAEIPLIRANFDKIVELLKNEWVWVSMLNPNGVVDYDDLIMSLLTLVSVDQLLNMNDLDALLSPVLADRLCINTDYPNAYTAFFEMPCKPFDLELFENTEGVEIGRRVERPEAKPPHIEYDFVVTSLAKLGRGDDE